MFESGNLEIKNNVFYHVAGNNANQVFEVSASQGVDVSQQEAVLDEYFLTASNTIKDPGVYVSDGNFYLFPTGNVFDNLAPLPDEWFETTTFKGAFLTYNWLSGWTLIDESGAIR
jgi:hypothetical protein